FLKKNIIGNNSPKAAYNLEPPEGWEMLFHGMNLENWYLVTRDTNFKGTVNDLFKIENGLIHVYPSQKDGTEQTFAGIITNKSYSHYNLTLEYKWGEKKYIPRYNDVRDAGLLFHVHGKDIIWPNSVECQIQEGDTGDIWAIGTQVSSKVQKVVRNYHPNGQLTTLGKPEQRFHRFHRAYSWEKPTWNRLDIEVRGDHAIYKVNGKLVNEVIDMKYWDEKNKKYLPLTEGKILLQAEGAEVYYRNIFIKEMEE
ncbi:MAG: DUF1080 domain-containing protein, partial [Bacteroidota bacterium]